MCEELVANLGELVDFIFDPEDEYALDIFDKWINCKEKNFKVNGKTYALALVSTKVGQSEDVQFLKIPKTKEKGCHACGMG